MGLGDKWKKQAEEAKANAEKFKAHKERMKTDPDYALRYKKNQHGLDFESYTEEDLRKKNTEQVEKLISSPYVDETFNLGIDLAGASTRDLYHIGRVQVHQNFMIIRQNEQMIRELKKLNQK